MGQREVFLPGTPRAVLFPAQACYKRALGVVEAMSSKQGYGLVPWGAQVLGGGRGPRRSHTVRGGVRSIQTSHLHIWEGLLAAARDRGQARGPQITAKRGVSKGPQRVQAEALILHLFPQVPLQRQKHSGELASGETGQRLNLCLGEEPKTLHGV